MYSENMQINEHNMQMSARHWKNVDKLCENPNQ